MANQIFTSRIYLRPYLGSQINGAKAKRIFAVIMTHYYSSEERVWKPHSSMTNISHNVNEYISVFAGLCNTVAI
jgi:hypothetical protein